MRFIAVCALGLSLAGCATAPLPMTAPPAACVGVCPTSAAWNGRLALRVNTQPVQVLSATFALEGTSQAGQLTLSTPLGSTLAVIRWSALGATLNRGSSVESFDSIDALLQHMTGTALPLEALFEWLAGRPAQVPGWQVDLSQYAQGLLQAQRTVPEPTVNLRAILTP